MKNESDEAFETSNDANKCVQWRTKCVPWRTKCAAYYCPHHEDSVDSIFDDMSAPGSDVQAIGH